MSTSQALFNISAVEKETGLSKETLRIWEIRYQFPKPLRSPQGDRMYTKNQITQLKMIQTLLQLNEKPKKIVGLSEAKLSALILQHSELLNQGQICHPEMIDLIHLHNQKRLTDALIAELNKNGYSAFISHFCPSLIREVGQLWSVGKLSVFEEHLFTQALISVFYRIIDQLSNTIAVLPNSPLFLLTTPPGERHSLGLLMAKIVLLEARLQVIDIGTETPITELAALHRSKKIDVLALSVTSALPASQGRQYLMGLTKTLPKSCEIWLGGSYSDLIKIKSKQVVYLKTLEDLKNQIEKFNRPLS